jgi:hypothetical protein
LHCSLPPCVVVMLFSFGVFVLLFLLCIVHSHFMLLTFVLFCSFSLFVVVILCCSLPPYIVVAYSHLVLLLLAPALHCCCSPCIATICWCSSYVAITCLGLLLLTMCCYCFTIHSCTHFTLPCVVVAC